MKTIIYIKGGYAATCYDDLEDICSALEEQGNRFTVLYYDHCNVIDIFC